MSTARAKARKRQLAHRQLRGTLTETDRVICLPCYPGPSLEAIEEVRRLVYLPGATDELNDVQLVALAMLWEVGGLLGLIGVGWGKTLIALLAPVVLGAERPVLLCPPGLVDQALGEIERFASSFRFDERLVILPYSKLQRLEWAHFLAEYKPDLIVCDEVHELANPKAARTGRVADVLESDETCRFAAMTGSITSTSVLDYEHLSCWALGDRSPLPRGGADLKAWARCLDAEGEPQRADVTILTPLCDAYEKPRLDECETLAAWQDHAREAFGERLRTAAGVLVTGAAAFSGEVRVVRRFQPRAPREIVEAIRHVLDSGESPDGSEVYPSDDAAWKAANELAQGFWYQWDWPASIGLEERENWRLARADWFRFVRRELDENRAVGYDSVLAVTNHVSRSLAARGGVPGTKAEEALADWVYWRERLADRLAAVARPDNGGSRTKPPTVARWISHYLVDDALDWLDAQTEPAVIWYQDRAVGQALEERGGIPAYRTAKARKALGHAPKAHKCAMPIKGLGTGRNLQDWRLARILDVPSSARTLEQLLGRHARQGQRAKTVDYVVDQGAASMQRAFHKAIRRARYIEGTLGQPQMILSATIVEDLGDGAS